MFTLKCCHRAAARVIADSVAVEVMLENVFFAGIRRVLSVVEWDFDSKFALCGGASMHYCAQLLTARLPPLPLFGNAAWTWFPKFVQGRFS